MATVVATAPKRHLAPAVVLACERGIVDRGIPSFGLEQIRVTQLLYNLPSVLRVSSCVRHHPCTSKIPTANKCEHFSVMRPYLKLRKSDTVNRCMNQAPRGNSRMLREEAKALASFQHVFKLFLGHFCSIEYAANINKCLAHRLTHNLGSAQKMCFDPARPRIIKGILLLGWLLTLNGSL